MPGPELKKIEEDKELQESLLRRHVAMINDQFKKLKVPFQFTEDDIQKVLVDEERIAKYKAYREIDAQNKQRTEEYYRLSDELGISVDLSLRRTVGYFMDISGTPEAKQKNIEFIKKASTLEGANEITTEFMKKIFTDDPKKYVTASTKELLETAKNDPTLLAAFTIFDATENSYALDPVYKDFYKRNLAIVQATSALNGFALEHGNPFSLITPDFPEEYRIYASLIAPAELKFGKELYKEGIDGVNLKHPDNEKSPCETGCNFLTSHLLNSSSNTPFIKAYQHVTGIGGRLEGKDPVHDYKYFKDGQELSSAEAISELDGENKDKVQLVEITNEEKAAYERGFERTQAMNMLNGKMETLQKLYRDLSSAHGLFTRKTPEFTRMKDTLNAFIEANKNSFKAKAVHTVDEMNRFIDGLNEVHDAVKNYVDIKSTQKQNAIRRTRVEIANKILDDVETRQLKSLVNGKSEAEKLHEAALARNKDADFTRVLVDPKELEEIEEVDEIEEEDINELDKGFVMDKGDEPKLGE